MLTIGAATISLLAGLSRPCSVDFFASEFSECRNSICGKELNRAPVPAVAAIGTAFGDVFSSVETYSAGSAMAPSNEDLYRVDELQGSRSQLGPLHSGSGYNGYFLSGTIDVREFYSSVNQSKQCMISTQAYAFAGMDASATLTNNNVPGANYLSAKNLCTQSLGITISTVLCGAATFLMRHLLFS